MCLSAELCVNVDLCLVMQGICGLQALLSIMQSLDTNVWTECSEQAAVTYVLL